MKIINFKLGSIHSKVLDSYIVTEMEKWKNGTSGGSNFKEKLSDKALEKTKLIRTLLTANRIAFGFEEIDIARKIGVTENDYKQMERGELQFGLGYLIEICEILGVKLKAVV